MKNSVLSYYKLMEVRQYVFFCTYLNYKEDKLGQTILIFNTFSRVFSLPMGLLCFEYNSGAV